MSLQKNIDNIEKDYDEIKQMDMGDYKDSDSRDQKIDNDKKLVTDVIEVFLLETHPLSNRRNHLEY